MSRRNLFWILSIASVAVFGLAVSYSAPTREKDHDYELVRLVVDVLHEVRQKYVVDIDPERERRLVEDMINGGLERLDPHSQYINPREYKAFDKQSEGKFGGIGIHVGYDRNNGGRLTVISPMLGTPAYEAGILAGDTIVKIDGKPTDAMRTNEAVDSIQGKPGSSVTLTILREGFAEPRDYRVERAVIKVPTVQGDIRRADDGKQWEWFVDKPNDIAYIRISTFGKNTAAELREVVLQLEKDGARGLILDLRNNPGGLLKAAVEVSDLFLSAGMIVSTKGRNYKDESYHAKAEGTLMSEPGKEIPIAVLVNRFSASASEIVSAALQDNKRAVIIGERTYGKGSVQNIILMENDSSALKLTTASYWRPSGKNIHRFPDKKDFEAAKITDPDEWGVRPDTGLEVKLTDEERLDYLVWRNERDVIRVKPPSGVDAAPTPQHDQKGKKPFEDRVMKTAVEHLRKEVAKAGPAKRGA
ncbi:MAG: S41 family peptidase [Planctomycetia bacterium]|nr:S41 family peptidase [Planctomycetia bacterium]